MSKQTSKLKILWVVVPLLVLIGGGIWILDWQSQKADKSLSSAQAVSAATSAPAKKTKVAYDGQEGKTALEILKATHKTTTKSSSLGELVSSIDGVEGNGPKYWLFYVNGKQADVGAGAYQTKKGDKIEWRLE